MRAHFARRTTSLVLGVLLLVGLQLAGSAVNAQGAVATRVAPGDHLLSLTVNHQTRLLLLHMPSNTTMLKRPLLLVYHGATDTGYSTEHMTDFTQVADRTGEVVAYLQGVNNHWNDQAGGPSSTNKPDDVAYTRAVIKLLESLISFDHKRIVAVGFSNGALMVEDLGCKLASKLAMIVPVEGELAASTSPGCAPSRPIRLYEIHGTSDSEISYNGGPIGGHGTVVLSAPKSAARWAHLDHCASTPKNTYPGSSVKLTTYSRCRRGVSVVLRTLYGGQHQWPSDIGEVVFSVLPPA